MILIKRELSVKELVDDKGSRVQVKGVRKTISGRKGMRGFEGSGV
jgi:hypothetical protein